MIREADIKDIDLVTELIQSFIGSIPEYALSLDSGKLVSMFTDGKHACLIEDEGKGFIAGVIVEEPVSNERILIELAWYVRPECRGIGVELLRSFERYAKNNGINRVVMVAINNGLHDVVSRFYKQNGYVLAETHFIRRI